MIAAGAVSGRAQSLLSDKPRPQYAAVSASSSAARVSPGSVVTLWADVVPHANVHVYAEGAREYTPVSLVLTPNALLAVGTIAYPKSTPIDVPGTTDRVPAYSGPFRIAVPVTVKGSAKSGDAIVVGAALHYQACDDRLCYPATVAPLSWTLTVK
ncbi:MAG: protein-disulfide reductase DsbD family protein [Vicinamibacterales bacterium]